MSQGWEQWINKWINKFNTASREFFYNWNATSCLLLPCIKIQSQNLREIQKENKKSPAKVSHISTPTNLGRSTTTFFWTLAIKCNTRCENMVSLWSNHKTPKIHQPRCDIGNFSKSQTCNFVYQWSWYFTLLIVQKLQLGMKLHTKLDLF